MTLSLLLRFFLWCGFPKLGLALRLLVLALGRLPVTSLGGSLRSLLGFLSPLRPCCLKSLLALSLTLISFSTVLRAILFVSRLFVAKSSRTDLVFKTRQQHHDLSVILSGREGKVAEISSSPQGRGDLINTFPLFLCHQYIEC